jgi:hypothetical protein
MTTIQMQESAVPRGRRAVKFSPPNVQKIKQWVADGISRENIAELLDVTVGSLQVTCSRLGISLKRRELHNDNTVRRVVGRPRTHPPMAERVRANSQFQIILERNGMQRTIDLPLSARDIAHLGLKAAVQNVGMARLLTEVVATAIKKDMIEEILREPSRELAPRFVPENLLTAPK